MKILRRHPEYQTAEHVAAECLRNAQEDQLCESLAVYACDAAIDPYLPIGIPLIDNHVASRPTFSFGTTQNDLQSSQQLPPRGQSEHFEQAFSAYEDRLRSVLPHNDAQLCLENLRIVVGSTSPDIGVTAYNFHHKNPTTGKMLWHGGLIISDKGDVLGSIETVHSTYSKKIMKAAQQVLTHARSGERLLLTVNDGQVEFVAPGVAEIVDSQQQESSPRMASSQ